MHATVHWSRTYRIKIWVTRNSCHKRGRNALERKYWCSNWYPVGSFLLLLFFFIFSCIEIAKNKFNEIAWQQLQLRAGISSNNNENQIPLQLDELVSAWWRCECERAYNLCDNERIIQQVVLKPLSRCFTLLFSIKCVCVCVY